MPEPTNPSSPSSTTPQAPSPSPVSAAGGAAPVPSVEPSAAPETDWGSLLGDAQDEGDPISEAAPPAPAPEQPAEPPVEPALEPQPEPVQPAEPVVAQQPTPPEGPTKEWVEGMVKKLTPMYEFAPETVEAFQETPEKVLPQLAAVLHTNIIQDVARMIDASNQQLLPNILKQHFGQHEQALALRQREIELVHTPYPKLREADPEVVQATAKAIAKKYPKSAPADRVRMLAERVYAAEGWDMPWKAAPSAPQAPARPNGYTPVAPGAGGGAPPRPADNPFASPELLNE